jgi:hypothetical protein
MELQIPVKHCIEVAKQFKEVNPYLTQQVGRRRITIPSTVLSRDCLKALFRLCKGDESAYVDDLRFCLMVKKNPDRVEVDTCKKLTEALPEYFTKNIIKGWVFRRGPYGSLYPYLIDDIEFFPARPRHGILEHVELSLLYVESSELVENNYSVSWSEDIFISNYAELFSLEVEEEDNEEITAPSTEVEKERREAKRQAHLKKMRKYQLIEIETLLEQEGLVKETEELHAEYEKQLARFLKIIQRYGKQFWARGSGINLTRDSYYSDYGNRFGRKRFNKQHRRSIYLDNDNSVYVDGKPAKVICDHQIKILDEEEEQKILPAENITIADLLPPPREKHSLKIFRTNAKLSGMALSIPIHPMVKIYHLETENDFQVHCMNLKPYEYRKDLINKLIIEEEVKELIAILTGKGEVTKEDIIEEKSQATNIALLGEPGVGKTLTAEVIAELQEKPLYKVQAATLGIDVDTLENNLKAIMGRAQNWDAVLLIDEANAYVHRRGTDIVQNAVVGVFLRLMESYRGILIFTSNKSDPNAQDEEDSIDVDDAILSRCQGVFNYKLPKIGMRRQIWKDQREIQELTKDLSDEVIEILTKDFAISGRSIRNLLGTTARFARGTKREMTVELFRTIAKYIPLTRTEKVKESSTNLKE